MYNNERVRIDIRFYFVIIDMDGQKGIRRKN